MFWILWIFLNFAIWLERYSQRALWLFNETSNLISCDTYNRFFCIFLVHHSTWLAPKPDYSAQLCFTSCTLSMHAITGFPLAQANPNLLTFIGAWHMVAISDARLLVRSKRRQPRTCSWLPCTLPFRWTFSIGQNHGYYCRWDGSRVFPNSRPLLAARTKISEIKKGSINWIHCGCGHKPSLLLVPTFPFPSHFAV